MDLEKMHADRVRSRMREISARLRDLADEVDRQAEWLDRIGEVNDRTYVTAIAGVQREVLWGFANLNLDNLTACAGDADAARARSVAEGG
jgi:hypothetical protein